MRYSNSENTWLLGNFPNGGTVTIKVIDLATDTLETLTSNSCAESANIDGLYRFDVSTNMTNSGYKNLAYEMTDGSTKFRGKFVYGGHVTDTVDSIESKVDAIPTDSLSATDSRLDTLDANISTIPTNPVLTNDVRLDNLDASISNIPTDSLLANDSRLSNLDANISSIPLNPLLTTDSRLDNLNASISSIPINPVLTNDVRLNTLTNLDAAVSGIPVNTVLTTDSRLDNLDALISSRSTLTDSEVWSTTTRELTVNPGMTSGQEAKLDALPTNPLLTTDVRIDNLDANISSIPTNPLLTSDNRLDYLDAAISSTVVYSPSQIWNYTTRSLTESTVTDLTPVLNAIAALNDITAADVENALIDETDGQTIIDTIVTAIGNTNLDAVTLVAAIRADVERVGGMLSSVPTGTLLANDARLSNLDAAISESGTSPAEIWSHVTRELTTTSGLTSEQEVTLNAILSDVTFIKDVEGGRWVLDGTEMIFYKADNVTEIARYSMRDGSSVPTSISPVERVRV